MTFNDLVKEELARARDNHPGFHSAHEGYAVIAEELDELWDWVKCRPSGRDGAAGLLECVQIAAMAQRFAEDILAADDPETVADMASYIETRARYR